MTVFLKTKPKFYSAVTYVDGIRFSSKAEAKEYGILKLRQRIGEINSLEIQPTFELHAFTSEGPILVGRYVADFMHREGKKTVVTEVKGFETALWKWKKRHFLAEYPELKLRIVK